VRARPGGRGTPFLPAPPGDQDPQAMPEIDAQSLADQAVLLGLVSRPDARLAVTDAEDGSVVAVTRSFLRKGLLTSWQLDRLQKGDPTGFFFGGCKVLFHLAEGTFARVYRGVKPETGTPVAIKVLRNRFVADRAAVERFGKEAEAGMKLRHPNIVRILDYGEEEKRHYMIMEYVEGANLRDFLKIRNRLTGDEALPLMIGLAEGLKYSFDSGVTHRDIKATNILISHAGEAKLVDFGLAGLQADSKSSIQSQRTVDYSALERTCGSEKGDPRSDIFFLGCVFYQMITGQAPMKESESKDMLQKMLVRSFSAIVPLSEHRLAPDPGLSHVIEKMMRVELKARYQNMDDVLADLRKHEERVKSGISGLEVTDEDEPEFLVDLDEIFTNRPGTPEAAGADAVLAPADDDGGPAAAKPRRHVKPILLCVESQAEIQDAFRKSLSRMGYRVILVRDAELATERFDEARPDAVVFDFDGLGAEAIDALNDMHEKAHEEGEPLNALVLLGPRQGALWEKVPTDDRIVILSKPVKMKQVQYAIQALVPVR
jgi:tRNA A-37 threonylcarbamoyl transferase component Bud32/CheY-like chemotaxis protein